MKATINSNPLEFEGLRHKQKVQRPAAQLPSGQNKKRPPLTMEPSIDDPLAAVTDRIYNSFVSGNTNSNRHTRAGMAERRDGMLG